MSNRSATGNVRLAFDATIQNMMDDSKPSASAALGETLSQRLTTGVSANMIDRAWEDSSRALASGVTETINFASLTGIDIGAGAGNDPLGLACEFEEIVLVVIRQISGTGRLEINPTIPANNLAWMPQKTTVNDGALRNGSWYAEFRPGEDGLAVTPGSSQNVNFKATGGPVVYAIYIFGRHDDDESSSSSTSSLSSSSSSSSSSTSTLSSQSSSSSASSSSSSISTKSSLSSLSSSSSSRSTLSSSSSSSSSHSRSSSSSLSSSSSSSSSTLSSSSSHSRSSSSSLSSSSTSSVSSSSSSSSTLSSSSSSSSSRLQ